MACWTGRANFHETSFVECVSKEPEPWMAEEDGLVEE